jgi:hypothetical protein
MNGGAERDGEEFVSNSCGVGFGIMTPVGTVEKVRLDANIGVAASTPLSVAAPQAVGEPPVNRKTAGRSRHTLS